MNHPKHNDRPCALVTGAAHRIGGAIARTLHQAGYQVILHANRRAHLAAALCAQLEQERPHSTALLSQNLVQIQDAEQLIRNSVEQWNRLDLLVHNAAVFYHTPLEGKLANAWSHVVDTNLKMPFFLSQAAFPSLKAHQGCIVHILDSHADGQPTKGYPIYHTSKAGLLGLTHAFAREMAPHVRVNAVAPGVIIPPTEAELAQTILDRIPLKRFGQPIEVAEAVLFLAKASYCTGTVVSVDGGRHLFN